MLLFQLADDGHAHGLAYIQGALAEVYRPRPARLQAARHVEHLMDVLFRAVEGTTAAAVAQLGKDEHLAADHGHGVLDTYLGAAATKATLVIICRGN
jgi:hypothetical protein